MGKQEEGDMAPNELISQSFLDYLRLRIPVLKILADMSSVSEKTI